MDFMRINPNTKKTRTEIIQEWINLHAESYRNRSKTNIENTLHNLD
jgi:hypothetical protein